MSEPKRYPIHPACAKWPRPSAADFEELVKDIKANGLINPIWLTEADEILEGKVRYEACLRAGVEPRFELYVDDDPIGFTISQNKLRRHLSKTDLAFIGEELAKLKHGSNQHKKKVDEVATSSSFVPSKEIAEQLGICRELINDVRALKRYGEPNVIELVKTNQVGLKNATSYARHTSREQQRIADVKTVKQQGTQLRTPLKNGITSKRMVAPIKSRKVMEITFSPEQATELIEKLRPITRRLVSLSKRPIYEFSPYDLVDVAYDIDKLLGLWANAEPDVPRKKASS